jgi:hypothetical protein
MARRVLYLLANLLGGVVLLLLFLDPSRDLWPVFGLLGLAVLLMAAARLLRR